MVTSGSMSGAEKRSDGPLGESASERAPLALGAAGPGRHRASPRLDRSTRSPEHFHLGLQPAAETVALGIEVVRGLEI